MTPRVVIVGAGHAGSQLAISLREKGFRGSISLLAGECTLPYQRPPLSKAFLLGKVSASELAIRPDAYFEEREIDLRIGTACLRIDRDRRVVDIRDGASIGYDHLVLATGVRNRRPGIAGEDLKGVHALRTFQDALDIRSALQHAHRLAILGAGFIGMEVAAVAAQLGRAVTVIERAGRVMPRAVSTPVAGHLEQRYRRGGVAFEFNAVVEALEEGYDGAVGAVRLRDGRSLEADMVLVAIGVVPAVELAQEAGIATDNGVPVDAMLQTSDPHVFAIGDCANALHELYPGRRVRLESIQNANDQARCVAATLIGVPTPYGSVPWFWSDQWDIKLQIAGLSAPDDHCVHQGDPSSARFSVMRSRDGRMTAVESINQAGEHMTARRLLRTAAAAAGVSRTLEVEPHGRPRADANENATVTAKGGS